MKFEIMSNDTSNKFIMAKWNNGESGEEYQSEADRFDEAIFKLRSMVMTAEGIFIPRSEIQFQFPDVIQDNYDVLKRYKQNNNLGTFHILHIYPTGEICYPNGYYDGQFFDIMGFNTETMEFSWVKFNADGIDYSGAKLYQTKIFLDGSFLVKFVKPVKLVINGQLTIFEPI